MDSKDRSPYSKTVITNHKNNEYQLSKNVLQLGVAKEEEEVENREQTSTQRVMKIEIVDQHHHQYQKTKDKIHHYKLSYTLKVLKAKQTNIKTVIQDICYTIFKKTRCKVRFFLTTTIQLPPQLIKNITINFPPTCAKL